MTEVEKAAPKSSGLRGVLRYPLELAGVAVLLTAIVQLTDGFPDTVPWVLLRMALLSALILGASIWFAAKIRSDSRD